MVLEVIVLYMLHGFVGFLIPGSKSSAYDQDDWILTLARVIRQLHEQRRQLVGVCFGHQLIAHALGGTVRAAYKIVLQDATTSIHPQCTFLES